jgi:hypothetical protein
MVRKQLYISDEHERALYAKAGELGALRPSRFRGYRAGCRCKGRGEGLAMAVVHEDLPGVIEHHHSHHDAQIRAAARPGRVGVIPSEAFNPRAVSGGVTFT